MSKIDEKFIQNLQNFSDSLENIVEILQEQQKSKTEDVVNELLKSIPDTLKQIVESQKEIIKGHKQIKTDTTKILAEIKEIRKKGETGMFESISGGDNRKKVTDAVKSIVLIAGGVLAIGLAFKIVGNVDFASVVGLSLSILLITEAFSKINKMKMGTGDVIFTSLMLVLISGALLASGWILSKIPDFSLEQGITIALLAGGLGVATWLILKATDKIDIKKHWATILALPMIMPLISLGILLSSYILSGVQPLDYKLILNIALIGLALGVAGIGVAFIIKTMKGVKWEDLVKLPATIVLMSISIVVASVVLQGLQPVSMKTIAQTAMIGLALGVAGIGIAFVIKQMKGVKWTDLLMLPASIALMSVAIVVASVVLQAFQPLSNPGQFLLSTLVIGLGLLIFTPTLVIIGKVVKKDWQALLVGAAGIVLLSLAIVATSWIFTLLPGEMRFPDLSWSVGVGLGMLLFLPTLIIVGLIGSTGAGLAVLGIGLIGLPILALSMLAVSYILSQGNWENGYPSIGWALGVGTALLLFGLATVVAAPAALVSGIFSFFAGEDPLVKLAKSMLAVSETLALGRWEEGTYPSPNWALGVGTSLYMFAGAFAIISAIEGIASVFGGELDFNKFVITASTSMITASFILSIGNWKAGYPTKEWSEGVGNALFMFAKAFAIISAIEGIGGALSLLTGKEVDFNQFVFNASNAMVMASKILVGGNWTSNFPSEEYAKGVGGLLIAMAKAYSEINSIGFMDIVSSIFGGGSKMDFDAFVISAASSIAIASVILAIGNYSKFPDENYVNNFGGFMSKMSVLIDEFELSKSDMDNFNYFLTNVLPNLSSLPQLTNMDLFSEGMNKFSTVLNNLPVDKHKEIRKLADSISDLADALNEINVDSFAKLSSMSQGVLLISVIDEAKLKSVLDTISDKKKELREIYGEETNVKETGFWDNVFGKSANEETEMKTNTPKEKEPRDLDKEQYYNNITEIKNLLQVLVENQNKPKQTPGFNK